MMIHLEDCGSIVVIVNPADKRKPYVYYAEGEINNFNQIAATTPEEEQDAIPTG
jgi:hypothetical protein